MTMSRDPHDEIRIFMKFGNQLMLGFKSERAPADIRFWRFDAYRYVRSDDHELTFSLALIKFAYQPGITFLVKRAMPIASIIAIVVLLGIVEHDNLDRYIRLRLKAIGGKVMVEVGLGETVTGRI